MIIYLRYLYSSDFSAIYLDTYSTYLNLPTYLRYLGTIQGRRYTSVGTWTIEPSGQLVLR